MLDITLALAKTVTSLLIPAIPYLLKGGEQAWSEASKKIGTDTWEWTKTIWMKLVSRSKSKTNGEESATEIVKAATEVANNPSDEDAQAALRLQIRKLLADDAELSSEITKVLEEAKASSDQTNIRIKTIEISGQSVVKNKGNFVAGDLKIDK